MFPSLLKNCVVLNMILINWIWNSRGSFPIIIISVSKLSIYWKKIHGMISNHGFFYKIKRSLGFNKISM